MIKAILFDVGGTLIHPHPSVGHVYALVLKRHGLKRDPAMLNKKFRALWKTKNKIGIKINKSLWRDLVYKTIAVKDENLFGQVFEEIYKCFEKPKSWRVFPDAKPTLKKFQKKYVLAVASNWDERLPSLLRKLALSRYFKYQFISFKIGAVKPDPRFFKTVLRKLQLQPQEILHVGDDPEKDYQGAKSMGLRSYLVDRKSDGKKPHIITKLTQLINRI